MNNRKETLLSLKHELAERISKIDHDLHSRKTSTKFSEQVTQGQNDDVLKSLKQEAEQELEHIEHALEKMANNLYGRCEKCHSAISEERLDAIPFAAFCKKCVS